MLAQWQAGSEDEKPYIKQSSSFDETASLYKDDGHLQHHCKETVTAQLLCNASHDELMRERRNKECDDSRNRSGHGSA